MSYRTEKVSDLADQIRGVTYSKEEASKTPSKGLKPILRAGNISEFGLKYDDLVYIPESRISDKQYIQRGDVLIAASSGSIDVVGKAAISADNFDGSFGAFCKVLRPNERVHPEYFAHHFKTANYRKLISSLAAGANINNLRNEDLDNLTIPLPPLPEQRRIAQILDKAEALRAKRRTALAKLDTLAQSIFVEEYGDPETNPKNIPTTLLTNLCVRITDGTHQSPKWSSAGCPFLFVSNIVGGEITYETEKFISIETHAELTRRCPIEVGDVLYSTVGSYGVPVIVRSDRKFAFQRHIAHLKPNKNLLNPAFLKAMLDSPPLKKQADRAAKGVAQKTVNLSEIQKFVVFQPPLPLQQAFARRVEAIETLKAAHRASLAKLDALFASLQHRAFRGEL